MPEEEKQLQTKKEMEEDIVTFLAGRAAEELKFDSVTNGASNDIEKATSLARTMITMYGIVREVRYGAARRSNRRILG